MEPGSSRGEGASTGAADARGRFVTDTTKCLVEGFLLAHRAEHGPQVIVFGEDSYLEQVEASCYQLLQRLCSSPGLLPTAAPPPGEFVKAYRRQLEHAETILSILPSSEVGGTVRSALSAREESFPRADIRLPGIRTAAGPLASMVRLAVAWSKSGALADEIMRRLEALIPRSRAPTAAETLECLRRGGRIGGASAVLGSVLVTESLLELRQGEVEPLENVRTHQRALGRHKDLALGDYPCSGEAWLSVMHGDLPEEAQALAIERKTALGLHEVPICRPGVGDLNSRRSRDDCRRAFAPGVSASRTGAPTRRPLPGVASGWTWPGKPAPTLNKDTGGPLPFPDLGPGPAACGGPEGLPAIRKGDEPVV